MAGKEYRIPFDRNGDLEHYPSFDSQWRDNIVFLASMELVPGVTTGRSAKYLHVIDVESNITYPMFVADLLDAITRGTVRQGIFPATYWKVQKRGQNYGLRRAKADEI